MWLNCDLGESFGAWSMGMDETVIPLIDQANIACGFHASDPVTMRRTLKQVINADVEIGAHPAYPDLVGFGRRSMACSGEEVESLIWYQTAALDGMARVMGGHVSYIKPHGALNNDMMRDDSLLKTVMRSVLQYPTDLKLMLPVTLYWKQHLELAKSIGITLEFEAFADRAYDAEGRLVSRNEPGSVYQDKDRIVDQATSFANQGGVLSINGKWLDLPAHSLCVHGDHADSVAAVVAIRDALKTQA